MIENITSKHAKHWRNVGEIDFFALEILGGLRVWEVSVPGAASTATQNSSQMDADCSQLPR